jgi:hypothetical protein
LTNSSEVQPAGPISRASGFLLPLFAPHARTSQPCPSVFPTTVAYLPKTAVVSAMASTALSKWISVHNAPLIPRSHATTSDSALKTQTSNGRLNRKTPTSHNFLHLLSTWLVFLFSPNSISSLRKAFILLNIVR